MLKLWKLEQHWFLCCTYQEFYSPLLDYNNSKSCLRYCIHCNFVTMDNRKKSSPLLCLPQVNIYNESLIFVFVSTESTGSHILTLFMLSSGTSPLHPLHTCTLSHPTVSQSPCKVNVMCCLLLSAAPLKVPFSFFSPNPNS